MDIWVTREQSMSWLNNQLTQESETIKQGFEFLNKGINLFEKIGNSEGDTLVGKFSRICAITLAKSSNLLLACYSLALDALSQESGAVLRPLLETYELLIYFRLNPSRVDEAIQGNLPLAGEIAQKISSPHKSFRKYLNDNASHFSYHSDSVRHLYDNNVRIKSLPTHSLDVFRVNLSLLNAFQVFVAIEAANCLFAAGVDANVLANEIEKWRAKSARIFSSRDS
jgi:hypothetical protein